MTRSMWLLMGAVVATGCGLGIRDGNGLVRDGQGLSKGCTGSGCQQAGWVACDDALANGATGDVCNFGGMCYQHDSSLGPAGDVVGCLSGHLLVGTVVESYGQAACGTAEQDGTCARHTSTSCQPGTTAPQHLSCMVGPGAPSRTLSTPWALASEADCEALRAGDAEAGDPCTGDFVCHGMVDENPDPTITSGEIVLEWCNAGALNMVLTLNGSGW